MNAIQYDGTNISQVAMFFEQHKNEGDTLIADGEDGCTLWLMPQCTENRFGDITMPMFPIYPGNWLVRRHCVVNGTHKIVVVSNDNYKQNYIGETK